jgi:hypothetical protein
MLLFPADPDKIILPPGSSLVGKRAILPHTFSANLQPAAEVSTLQTVDIESFIRRPWRLHPNATI